jgi:hypothetical protein
VSHKTPTSANRKRRGLGQTRQHQINQRATHDKSSARCAAHGSSRSSRSSWPWPGQSTRSTHGTWSVGCGVWSVECGVWSVECGVWSVEVYDRSSLFAARLGASRHGTPTVWSLDSSLPRIHDPPSTARVCPCVRASHCARHGASRLGAPTYNIIPRPPLGTR